MNSKEQPDPVCRHIGATGKIGNIRDIGMLGHLGALGRWDIVGRFQYGASSWAGFKSRCPTLSNAMGLVGTKMKADAAGSLWPVYWVGLLQDPGARCNRFGFANSRSSAGGIGGIGCIGRGVLEGLRELR